MSITWGQPRPKPTGATTGPWYTDPYLWMNLAGTAADAWASTSSAHQANRTNIQLQREQRDWQERMSGTEIQRRKADLIAAGGNPALAFTEGQGASSPSVAAPHVEPTFRPGGLGGAGTAALQAAQIRNMNAQTANTMESTRGKTMTNNILNTFGVPKAATEQDIRQIDKDTRAFTYDNTLPLTVDKLRAEIKNLGMNTASTAAELDRFNRMTNSVVALIQQQQEAGELDLDAIRNVASLGGLEANKIKPLIDLAIEFFGNRRSIKRGY